MLLVPRNSYLDIIQDYEKELKDDIINIDTRFTGSLDAISISFDGKDFVPFAKGMKIPEQYHELHTFRFKVKALQEKNKLMFVSDPITVIKYLAKVDDKYPQLIKSLQDRITNLELELARVLTATKQIRDVVKDIYEEGDII